MVSGQLQKTRDHDELWLEPAIWSRDTGQQIPCFDRCQLLITWMSNIKEVHGKPIACEQAHLWVGYRGQRSWREEWGDLVLSTELIMWISHRKEIRNYKADVSSASPSSERESVSAGLRGLRDYGSTSSKTFNINLFPLRECGTAGALVLKPFNIHLLLYGKLRERARWTESRAEIGYPSGQDGAILPARDYPLYPASKISPKAM